MAAFGQPAADEEVIEIGGGTARIRRTEPSKQSIGYYVDWSWVRDCWLATGHSFDDTHFELAPHPEPVIEQVLGSPLLTSFLSYCPQTSCATPPEPPPGRQTAFRLTDGVITFPDSHWERLSGWFLLSDCISPNTFVAGRIETLRFSSVSAAIESTCPDSGYMVGSTIYGGDRPVSFASRVRVDGEPSTLVGDGPQYQNSRLLLDLEAGDLRISIVAIPEERAVGDEPMCSAWGFE